MWKSHAHSSHWRLVCWGRWQPVYLIQGRAVTTHRIVPQASPSFFAGPCPGRILHTNYITHLVTFTACTTCCQKGDHFYVHAWNAPHRMCCLKEAHSCCTWWFSIWHFSESKVRFDTFSASSPLAAWGPRTWKALNRSKLEKCRSRLSIKASRYGSIT